MILAIPIETFSHLYVTFLDAKNNVVIDGKFSKILYVDDKTIINSLHIVFDSSLSTQQTILFEIERNLLESYKTFFKCNKNCIYMLRQNLLCCPSSSASSSFFSSKPLMTSLSTSSRNTLHSCKSCVKISGIWENDHNIGITYKLMNWNEMHVLPTAC